MPNKRPNNLFKPGQSGNPAGRKKGEKNKLTYKREVWEACVEANVDPFLVLAQIAAGKLETPEGTPEKINAYLRKEAAAELCQYLAPKLKSIEHKGGTGESFQLIINTKPFIAEVHDEKETNEE
jgi:hypothetical protein